MPESTFVFTTPSMRMASALPTANPMRQPVMLYVFDSDPNSTATSFAPGTSRMLGATYPSNVISA